MGSLSGAAGGYHEWGEASRTYEDQRDGHEEVGDKDRERRHLQVDFDINLGSARRLKLLWNY